MKNNTVAVFTSGGDAPGMNACIKGIVDYAFKNDMKILAIRSGYKGLIAEDFIELTPEMVKDNMHRAGTFIKTSRYHDFFKPEIQKKAVEILKNHNINYLIGIGGDGTYRGLIELKKLGINVIGIPGTIDNDINYSETSLGFDTAYNAATENIKAASESMRSFDRVFVAEVMGRHSGNIALNVAIASGADIVAVPEKPITADNICKKVNAVKAKGNNSPVIIVHDYYPYYDELLNKLRNVCKLEARSQIIGFVQRGASPTAYDTILGWSYGIHAIELCLKNKFGIAIGTQNNRIFDCDIEKSLTYPSNFDIDLYNKFDIWFFITKTKGM